MRVLCLGNNTEDTDIRTRRLAAQEQQECHGLVVTIDDENIKKPGYYHTSIYDLTIGDLTALAKDVDKVIVLDQPKDQWSHPTAFYNTVKLVKDLKSTVDVVFLDPAVENANDFFETLVEQNKSFCIFPFIELLVNNDSTTVCCRSTTPITGIDQLKDFKNDSNYRAIRQKMLNGIMIPEHCSKCYETEARGIVSSRESETAIWANILGLNSIEDLLAIENPAYYEVRPSNVCNLQCRMCTPNSSRLIADEYQAIGLVKNHISNKYTNFDFVKFDGLVKLYVAGGEPTAMFEFYEFLDKCIDNNQTNFELMVNTNATKLSTKFKNQITKFSNMQFTISIDGYSQVNDYIRWLSGWDTVIDNAKYLNARHKIIFNVTVSIYNVANLFRLLEFFDQEFPGVNVHCQAAEGNNDLLSPFNYPDKQSVIDNLLPVRNLNCYKNDYILSNFIDKLIEHYQTDFQVDLVKLSKFFEFNDLLDRSRNVKLINYIPELDVHRRLVQ